MRKDKRTAFEAIRDDAAQLENYKSVGDDSSKLRKEEDAVQMQVMAEDETENERHDLTEFIITNRGYPKENIPWEKALLSNAKISNIKTLRQIKQGIENQIGRGAITNK